MGFRVTGIDPFGTLTRCGQATCAIRAIGH